MSYLSKEKYCDNIETNARTLCGFEFEGLSSSKEGEAKKQTETNLHMSQIPNGRVSFSNVQKSELIMDYQYRGPINPLQRRPFFANLKSFHPYAAERRPRNTYSRMVIPVQISTSKDNTKVNKNPSISPASYSGKDEEIRDKVKKISFRESCHILKTETNNMKNQKELPAPSSRYKEKDKFTPEVQMINQKVDVVISNNKRSYKSSTSKLPSSTVDKKMIKSNTRINLSRDDRSCVESDTQVKSTLVDKLLNTSVELHNINNITQNVTKLHVQSNKQISSTSTTDMIPTNLSNSDHTVSMYKPDQKIELYEETPDKKSLSSNMSPLMCSADQDVKEKKNLVTTKNETEKKNVHDKNPKIQHNVIKNSPKAAKTSSKESGLKSDEENLIKTKSNTVNSTYDTYDPNQNIINLALVTSSSYCSNKDCSGNCEDKKISENSIRKNYNYEDNEMTVSSTEKRQNISNEKSYDPKRISNLASDSDISSKFSDDAIISDTFEKDKMIFIPENKTGIAKNTDVKNTIDHDNGISINNICTSMTFLSDVYENFDNHMVVDMDISNTPPKNSFIEELAKSPILINKSLTPEKTNKIITNFIDISCSNTKLKKNIKNIKSGKDVIENPIIPDIVIDSLLDKSKQVKQKVKRLSNNSCILQSLDLPPNGIDDVLERCKKNLKHGTKLLQWGKTKRSKSVNFIYQTDNGDLCRTKSLSEPCLSSKVDFGVNVDAKTPSCIEEPPIVPVKRNLTDALYNIKFKDDFVNISERRNSCLSSGTSKNSNHIQTTSSGSVIQCIDFLESKTNEPPRLIEGMQFPFNTLTMNCNRVQCNISDNINIELSNINNKLNPAETDSRYTSNEYKNCSRVTNNPDSLSGKRPAVSSQVITNTFNNPTDSMKQNPEMHKIIQENESNINLKVGVAAKTQYSQKKKLQSKPKNNSSITNAQAFKSHNFKEKYVTKAEYVEKFAKNKSCHAPISLSIEPVPRRKNLVGRRNTFTCEADNETILKKIDENDELRKKCQDLFGSCSDEDEPSYQQFESERVSKKNSTDKSKIPGTATDITIRKNANLSLTDSKVLDVPNENINSIQQIVMNKAIGSFSNSQTTTKLQKRIHKNSSSSTVNDIQAPPTKTSTDITNNNNCCISEFNNHKKNMNSAEQFMMNKNVNHQQKRIYKNCSSSIVKKNGNLNLTDNKNYISSSESNDNSIPHIATSSKVQQKEIYNNNNNNSALLYITQMCPEVTVLRGNDQIMNSVHQNIKESKINISSLNNQAIRKGSKKKANPPSSNGNLRKRNSHSGISPKNCDKDNNYLRLATKRRKKGVCKDFSKQSKTISEKILKSQNKDVNFQNKTSTKRKREDTFCIENCVTKNGTKPISTMSNLNARSDAHFSIQKDNTNNKEIINHLNDTCQFQNSNTNNISSFEYQEENRKKRKLTVKHSTLNSLNENKHRPVSQTFNDTKKAKKDTTKNKKTDQIRRTCPSNSKKSTNEIGSRNSSTCANFKNKTQSQLEINSGMQRTGTRQSNKTSRNLSTTNRNPSVKQPSLTGTKYNETIKENKTQNVKEPTHKLTRPDRRYSAPEVLSIVPGQLQNPNSFCRVAEQVNFENLVVCPFLPAFPKLARINGISITEDDCCNTCYICESPDIYNDAVVIKQRASRDDVAAKIENNTFVIDLSDVNANSKENLIASLDQTNNVLRDSEVQNTITLYRSEDFITKSNDDVQAVSESIIVPSCNKNTITNLTNKTTENATQTLSEALDKVAGTDRNLESQDKIDHMNQTSGFSQLNEDPCNNKISHTIVTSDTISINTPHQGNATISKNPIKILQSVTIKNSNPSRNVKDGCSETSSNVNIETPLFIKSTATNSIPNSVTPINGKILNQKNKASVSKNSLKIPTNQTNYVQITAHQVIEGGDEVKRLHKELPQSHEAEVRNVRKIAAKVPSPNIQFSQNPLQNMVHYTKNCNFVTNENCLNNSAVDLTDEDIEITVDVAAIVDIFFKHIYFRINLCQAQNAYTDRLKDVSLYQDYFKAELSLFEKQKEYRLISQSLRLFLDLRALNIRITQHSGVVASKIMEKITERLMNAKVSTPVTKSLVYFLLLQLIWPQKDSFTGIPLLKALTQLCLAVFNRVNSKSNYLILEAIQDTYHNQLSTNTNQVVSIKQGLTNLQQQNKTTNEVLPSFPPAAATSQQPPRFEEMLKPDSCLVPLTNPSINSQCGIIDRAVYRNALAPLVNEEAFVVPKIPNSIPRSTKRYTHPRNEDINLLGNTPRYIPNYGTHTQTRVYAPVYNIPAQTHNQIPNSSEFRSNPKIQDEDVNVSSREAHIIQNKSQYRNIMSYMKNNSQNNGYAIQEGNAVVATDDMLSSLRNVIGPHSQSKNINTQLQGTVQLSTSSNDPSLLPNDANNKIGQRHMSDIREYRNSINGSDSFKQFSSTYENSVSPQHQLSNLMSNDDTIEKSRKRNENLLEELLDSGQEDSHFSSINDNFKIKLPFSRPFNLTTTTTTTVSSEISNKAVDVLPSNVTSNQNDSSLNANAEISTNTKNFNNSESNQITTTALLPQRSPSTSTSNKKLSLPSIKNNQLPILDDFSEDTVLVNDSVASSKYVVGQPQSKVLNQGLEALSSIGSASAMLNSFTDCAQPTKSSSLIDSNLEKPERLIIMSTESTQQPRCKCGAIAAKNLCCCVSNSFAPFTFITRCPSTHTIVSKKTSDQLISPFNNIAKNQFIPPVQTMNNKSNQDESAKALSTVELENQCIGTQNNRVSVIQSGFQQSATCTSESILPHMLAGNLKIPSVSSISQITVNKAMDESEEKDAIEVIDLTWIDTMDEKELQREIDFVFVKKEEPEDKLKQPDMTEEETVYTFNVQKLCCCSKAAEFNCACGEAWYCGRKCQLKDWELHHKVCQITQPPTDGEKYPQD